MVGNGEVRVLEWNTHLVTAISPSFLLQSQSVSTGLNNFRLKDSCDAENNIDLKVETQWGEDVEANHLNRIFESDLWADDPSDPPHMVICEIEPDAMHV